MEEKSTEEKEESELHEKNQHFSVVYTMICNLLQVKHCANANDNIEILWFELEQDKKYSWGTLFNGIFSSIDVQLWMLSKTQAMYWN